MILTWASRYLQSKGTVRRHDSFIILLCYHFRARASYERVTTMRGANEQKWIEEHDGTSWHLVILVTFIKVKL